MLAQGVLREPVIVRPSPPPWCWFRWSAPCPSTSQWSAASTSRPPPAWMKRRWAGIFWASRTAKRHPAEVLACSYRRLLPLNSQGRGVVVILLAWLTVIDSFPGDGQFDEAGTLVIIKITRIIVPRFLATVLDISVLVTDDSVERRETGASCPPCPRWKLWQWRQAEYKAGVSFLPAVIFRDGLWNQELWYVKQTVVERDFNWNWFLCEVIK